MRPARGAELELGVDSLAFGGAGVARADGYVLFVSGALPGDRVRAVVTKAKRGYAEARTLEVLEPSPDRVAPRADHPGAPWQVLPYERQLEVKQEQVDDALRRIGRLDGFELEPIVPAVEQWRYRNKLEYSFGADDAGGLVCGFHAPGRFDLIEQVDDCLLASEPGNAARGAVLDWCIAEGLGAYDRREHDGAPAQPRGARGPAQRPAAGAPRHLAARPPRGGARGRRSSRWSAVDPHRLDGRDHRRGRDAGAGRERVHRRGAVRAALP